MNILPDQSRLTIGFAHAAYQLADEFCARGAPSSCFEVRTLDELQARVYEADVLVVSGLWRNELLRKADRLRFIQSISAGTDQFARDLIAAKGVRLASAQGANERAVAEHAMALILSLARQLHRVRDNQARAHWRGMIADRRQREQELGGRILLILGLGRIGSRLAALARTFDMQVIGVKRQSTPVAGVEQIVPPERLLEVLPQADFVVLTCPLTPETEGLISRKQLEAMKPSSYLINVARGRIVDESALISALEQGMIAGAALDCFHEEPLPLSSPLWRMPDVIMTPHSAGETQRYESNIIDLLQENLARLYRGDPLKNQIV
ncbi:D-2-hydroxyacid dehydrogenase [Microvirga massiliensis]|uniref:D-2-hydroxyacid dehydrogenase n=1 Tax=Microvirga massiliensis TaxID=1033741 RepID=UPI00062BEAC3|nr:D-2-hydroxyacid dehydrogenase [Microvirga massiliensis]